MLNTHRKDNKFNYNNNFKKFNKGKFKKFLMSKNWKTNNFKNRNKIFNKMFNKKFYKFKKWMILNKSNQYKYLAKINKNKKINSNK